MTYPIIMPRYWYTNWELLGYCLCRRLQRSLERLWSLRFQPSFTCMPICLMGSPYLFVCMCRFINLWVILRHCFSYTGCRVSRGMESLWIVCGYGFGRIIFGWIFEKRTVKGWIWLAWLEIDFQWRYCVNGDEQPGYIRTGNFIT
jgi:hypothetical protein